MIKFVKKSKMHDNGWLSVAGKDGVKSYVPLEAAILTDIANKSDFIVQVQFNS